MKRSHCVQAASEEQQRRERGQPLEICPRSVGLGRRGEPQTPLTPPWSSLAEARATVGRRVRLYWGGDGAWYAGRIVLVHPTSRQVFIKYDDHDERWHAMWEEVYEWEDGACPAAGGAAGAAEKEEHGGAAAKGAKRIGPRRAQAVTGGVISVD